MNFDLVFCESRLVSFSKGKDIYLQHDNADGFYFIESGLVALNRLLLNGKEVLSRVYAKDQYFGYRTLLSGQTYHVGATALTDVTLTKIHITNVDAFFQGNIDFIRYLMNEMATELRHAEIRLSKMPSHSVELRVIDSMIDLVKIDSSYNWTYREIASHCGCSTETVIRVSKKLKSSQLMEGSNTHKSFDVEKLYHERMRLAML
jgi:CRP-like cAMP-binding protein